MLQFMIYGLPYCCEMFFYLTVTQWNKDCIENHSVLNAEAFGKSELAPLHTYSLLHESLS